MATNKFISDFSLFPIKKYGVPGWEYRKATWPEAVESCVHDIFDDINLEPIHYTRTTIYDKRIQYCKVSKQGNDVIMEPGDGYNFWVRRDTLLHKKEKEIKIDDSVVPHTMVCKICLTNKMTHAVKECGHVSMCAICANEIYKTQKECPICRTKMTSYPIKLFFA